jgi:hypothetical protein
MTSATWRCTVPLGDAAFTAHPAGADGYQDLLTIEGECCHAPRQQRP